MRKTKLFSSLILAVAVLGGGIASARPNRPSPPILPKPGPVVTRDHRAPLPPAPPPISRDRGDRDGRFDRDRDGRFDRDRDRDGRFDRDRDRDGRFARDRRDLSRPTIPPPAPLTERAPAFGNFIWVTGQYKWMYGQYIWIPGHYERKPVAKVYVAGHWQLRHGTYVWIPGRWVTARR